MYEFLSHFLPHHRPSAVEYEMPQYSEHPDQVFATIDDALLYLETNSTEAHSLYWENVGFGDARFGMVFPTSDGQFIYGLSCDCEDEKVADSLLDEMKQFMKTDIGYIAFEEPPPRTAQEFMEIVKSL